MRSVLSKSMRDVLVAVSYDRAPGTLNGKYEGLVSHEISVDRKPALHPQLQQLLLLRREC